MAQGVEEHAYSTEPGGVDLPWFMGRNSRLNWRSFDSEMRMDKGLGEPLANYIVR